MIVTATQMKVKSIFGLFRFFRHVKNIKSQMANVEGLVFQELKGFSTLTGWENKEAMKAFRNNGHHLDAMKNIKNMGKAKSVTWEALAKPDWSEAKEKLRGIQF